MKNAGPEGFAGFPVLLCVGEGLAPPESPRARPGEPRAGQATAPTTAPQEVRRSPLAPSVMAYAMPPPSLREAFLRL